MRMTVTSGELRWTAAATAAVVAVAAAVEIVSELYAVMRSSDKLVSA